MTMPGKCGSRQTWGQEQSKSPHPQLQAGNGESELDMMQVFELSKPSPVIYLFQSGLPRHHHQLETKYSSVAQDYLRHLGQTTCMLITLLMLSYSPRGQFIIFRLQFLQLLHLRELKNLVNPSSHPSSIYVRTGKFPGQGKTWRERLC